MAANAPQPATHKDLLDTEQRLAVRMDDQDAKMERGFGNLRSEMRDLKGMLADLLAALPGVSSGYRSAANRSEEL